MECIRLIDDRMVVEFRWENVFAYLGYRNVIASALMTRLFVRAFAELAPETPPDRDELSMLVAFPGSGIIEAVELITRLPTRHPDRFIVDTAAGPERAPAAPEGRFYFEVGLGTVRNAFVFSPTVLDDAFRSMVMQYEGRRLAEDDDHAYRRFKMGKVREILDCPDSDLFAACDVEVPLN
ncbi:MAG TPA: hypothetical protein VJ932_06125 [Alkalispirochaeta sp.]|nr:hypothetical protein [Alkalispirochaeta sp.]